MKKNIVVYVDDLDRVTPGTARDVLDNLRTFFDEKEITFIVTGDHSVLERYLGAELLPGEETFDQIEEGRRYLKKVFNVYWRLPLPLDKEINDFIDEELKYTNIKTYFSEDSEFIKFREYLSKYFEKNFRQINRFIGTVDFTFKVIDGQLLHADEKEKPYLQDLKNHPLLVVRVLMIQDLCNPLFERIANKTRILRELEDAVRKRNDTGITKILEESKLSHKQKAFIQQFLYEPDRFYKGYGPIVKDIKSFIHLAADSSFRDTRGATGENFVSLIQGEQSPEILEEIISETGAENVSSVISASTKYLSSEAPFKEKYSFTVNLFVGLANISVEYTVQEGFIKGLSKADITFVNSLSPEEKDEFYSKLFSWLNNVYKNMEPSITDAFISSINSTLTIEYVRKLASMVRGPFSSQCLSRFCITKYLEPATKNQILQFITEIFNSLKDTDIVISETSKGQTELLSDLIAENSSREIRYELIKNYLPDGAQQAKTKVLSEVKNFNTSIFAWASSDAVLNISNWKRVELEDSIIANLESVETIDQLKRVFDFALNRVIHNIDIFWKTVADKHIGLLFDNPQSILGNTSYLALAPSEEAFLEFLFKEFVRSITTNIFTDDDTSTLTKVRLLKNDNWVWKNLSLLPKVKSNIKKIYKSVATEIQDVVKNVLISWGQEPNDFLGLS